MSEPEEVTISITPDTKRSRTPIQRVGASAVAYAPWLGMGAEISRVCAEFEATMSRIAALSGQSADKVTKTFLELAAALSAPDAQPARSTMHAAYDHRRRARRRRNRR